LSDGSRKLQAVEVRYSSNPSDCPIHVSGCTRHANEDYRTSMETSWDNGSNEPNFRHVPWK
jgi:hypothetical protein